MPHDLQYVQYGLLLLIPEFPAQNVKIPTYGRKTYLSMRVHKILVTVLEWIWSHEYWIVAE